MNILRKNYTKITNDVNKYHIRKSMCKIIIDLYENACTDRIVKKI